MVLQWFQKLLYNTVRSRPEAQRTRSLQKCFSRIFTLFHWIRLFNYIIYFINSPVVLYVLVESSRCSSKSLQKESRPLRLWTRPYGGITGKDSMVDHVVINKICLRQGFTFYSLPLFYINL